MGLAIVDWLGLAELIRNNRTMSTEEKLKQSRDELHQEWVHLQFVGRALTPEEQQRAQALGQAVPLLDQALEVLGHCLEGDEEPIGVNLLNVSYTAANDQISADHRIDITESGIISMDLFRPARTTRTYLASIRTGPGATLRQGQRRFGMIGQDHQGNQAGGMLEVDPISETQANVRRIVEQPPEKAAKLFDPETLAGTKKLAASLKRKSP